jgi:hypothetical protein
VSSSKLLSNPISRYSISVIQPLLFCTSLKILKEGLSKEVTVDEDPIPVQLFMETVYERANSRFHTPILYGSVTSEAKAFVKQNRFSHQVQVCSLYSLFRSSLMGDMEQVFNLS